MGWDASAGAATLIVCTADACDSDSSATEPVAGRLFASTVCASLLAGAGAFTVRLGKSTMNVLDVRAPADARKSRSSPAGEKSEEAVPEASFEAASPPCPSTTATSPDPPACSSSRSVGVITQSAMPAAMAVAPVAMRCALRMRRCISSEAPEFNASNSCFIRPQSPVTSGSKPRKLFFN